MKHFSCRRIFPWSLKKCLLPISIATVVRVTNFFVKIIQPISPNYPWEKGVKKIQSAEEELLQSCILCSIIKDKDPNSSVKMPQKNLFCFFYRYLSYTSWVDVTYLPWCITFLKSPWYPVLTFFAEITISWPIKYFRKYLMTHIYA